jgi:hypothetical protein
MPDPVTIVIRPSLEELRASKTVLSTGDYSFFVQAWRIDALHPLNCVVTGALFYSALLDQALKLRASPMCILGTRGDRPARAQVMLATAPAGLVCHWSSADLVAQELYLTLPAVIPWLPSPTTFHLRNGLPVPTPPPEPSASDKHANPNLRS